MNREREELERLQEYLNRAIARHDKPAKIAKLTRRVEAQQRRVDELEKYEAERARKAAEGVSDRAGHHEWLVSAFAIAAMSSGFNNRVRKALWS